MLTLKVYLFAVDVCLSKTLHSSSGNIANLDKDLFGMNVNVLDRNPSWLWYIAFSLPMMTILILVWIIFKYTPVGHHIYCKA